MTKDNWIKAFDKKFPYNGCIFEDDGRSYNFEDIKDFISQVEKDAKSESYTNGYREGFDAGVEKTNKRWREKIMRFSMPSCPISSMEYPPGWWYSSFGMAIKEDFMRRISDLLEDKK